MRGGCGHEERLQAIGHVRVSEGETVGYVHEGTQGYVREKHHVRVCKEGYT